MDKIVTVDAEPLFGSAHAALVFAFNFSSQHYSRPLMNRMASATAPSGKGLSGLDGAAQAGMIRAEVKALGALSESILIARYAPHDMRCECRSSCCSGKRPNKEWANAIGYLSDHIRHTALAGCTAHGMLRREYVIRYFLPKDQRISFEQIAKKYKIAINTVSAHSLKVTQEFGGNRNGRDTALGLEGVALGAFETRLTEIGVVG